MSDTISKENTTVKNKHQVTASTEDKNKEDNDESQAVIVLRKKRDRMKSKAKTKSENSAVREQELTMVMNIGDPLAKLQELIEENVGYSLGKTVFSLQDSEELDRKSSLVELCVEGEGMVQVNCELKEMPNGLTKVNIVDILKPAEDIVEVAEDEIGELQANGKNLRWVVDQAFKNHLLSQNTPQDPGDWSIEETREWLMWAVMEFGLEGVDVKSWDKDGASLLGLSVDELRALIPVTNLLFWSHIEILRTCRVVAVPQRSDPDSLSEGSISEPELTGEVIGEPGEQQSTELQAASKSSGAVQLWKFLLELLTDFNHRDCIQWLEAEGEFKFTNPELVAQLWGIRKRKPNMNYDKLSRAMRYYYDGEMIQKVSGKRFVYKFICDLKQLVGYTSQELNSRVILAELEKKAALRKKGPDLSAPIQINDFLALIP